MTAVYKGFRTRDFPPRVLPGSSLPKLPQRRPTPPAAGDLERTTPTPGPLPK